MAHPDLDTLFNSLLPLAEQMLSKHGEFFPFGAVMRTNGKVESHAAHDGGEQPASQKLIEMMTRGFRQQAAKGTIRAAAICYDVLTLPPGQAKKTDAICVSAEHRNGEAVDVYVPYVKGWFGKVSYGEIFAVARENQIFSR